MISQLFKNFIACIGLLAKCPMEIISLIHFLCLFWLLIIIFFLLIIFFFVFQLVLKPTSSSVLRQPSQDTPGTLPAFVSHGLSDTAMSDETSQQPTASPLQAVSTIKALAAMQKSSPVFSANSFAHGSPLNSQTPSSLP